MNNPLHPACYILYSKGIDKFYIGATHEDINKWLENHNNHTYGNHRFTAKANDWVVFLVIDAIDYPHAIRIERKIKSYEEQKIYPEFENISGSARKDNNSNTHLTLLPIIIRTIGAGGSTFKKREMIY